MNFRGGCCVRRYGGGGGGYDMSKVDRIMMRYRPIAPKPDSGGCCSGGEKSGSLKEMWKSGRGKRKYSKEKSRSSGGSDNSNGNSKRSNKGRKGCNVGEMVTLPLLPETPERKEWASLGKVWSATPPSLWLSNGGYEKEMVASSLLTVESVWERWEEGEYCELGYCTDEEKKMSLEKDTCPGFISDGRGRVVWTNESYKKLVFGKDEEECSSGKMSVWLVMRERFLLTKQEFTCRMRVQYRCCGKEMSSMTLFCDVWRMSEAGGFAWRLDVNAALSLGR